MKAIIQYIVQTRFSNGQTFTAVDLDVPLTELAQYVAGLSRPSNSTSRLRVRISRPDGALTEGYARPSGISVAARGEAPARLVFDALLPEDAPVGCEVILLGYETE